MKTILLDRSISYNLSTSEEVFSIEGESILLTQKFDVQSPSALVAASATDIDVADFSFAKEAHGFLTGTKVQIATSDTLPDGLVAETDYFIIKLSDDKIALAASFADSVLGIPVELVDAGVGDQTITMVALSGASWQLQYSGDGENFFDVAAATSITADVVSAYEKLNPSYKFLKVKYSITAGQVVVYKHILIKG